MDGVGLSEDGRAQAAALAASFAGRPIAAVISSPLQRAQETAVPIAAQLGLPVTINAGFNEIDFGEWTGRAFSALEGDPAWDAWNRFRSVAACPGGESMLAAGVRALGAMGALRAAYPDGELVVVSHQDVLKALLAHLLGIPLDLFGRIALDPAHRSVVALWDSDVRVEGINLPAGKRLP